MDFIAFQDCGKTDWFRCECDENEMQVNLLQYVNVNLFSLNDLGCLVSAQIINMNVPRTQQK